MKNNTLYSIDRIKKFINGISKKNINKIAIESTFTKRISKLDGFTFFKAFTFGVYSLQSTSLRTIASFCEDICDGLTLSRQALENKLATGSQFLKAILKYIIEDKMLKTITHNHIDIFQIFNDVKICDSSIIQLNDSLKDIFKGFGGKVNSDAALKMQTVFSFKNKQLSSLEIQSGVKSDTDYMKELVNEVNTNELLLVDLGYFDKKSFKKLESKSAYFLSKIKYNTALYKENLKKHKLERVDLVNFLKKSNGIVDTYLYLGMKSNNREEFRVIAKKLPEEIVNSRIRRAKQKAKDQGRTLKNIDRELMSWVIMITNLDSHQADVDMLFDIYRLRWQIELQFKCWKSYAKIDNVKSAKLHYLECLLYGRLIMILLINTIYSNLYFQYKSRKNIEISMLMVYSTIGGILKEICLNLIPKRANLKKIYNMLVKLGKYCKREKRNRKTTEERLMEHLLPPVY